METNRSVHLVQFYNEGIRRIAKLMQQRNFDHAFVIVDLLRGLPLSEYDKLQASVKSYCEVYPEETWARKYIRKRR